MRIINHLLLGSCLLTIISCQPKQSTPATASTDSNAIVLLEAPIRDNVLTAAEQEALTPDIVLEELKAGNAKFTNNELTARDNSAMVRKAATGQYPKAVILSCLDSRVPVEDVFNEGIGDLFVGRVAGNIVNDDLLGSMEYGCKVAGAKLIVVLGHGSCGAVKAAIDNVQLGNITTLLSKIRPAVDSSNDYQGDKSSKNTTYVAHVTELNVLHSMEIIRKNSPILKELEANGQIKIVGALYDIETGKVRFL